MSLEDELRRQRQQDTAFTVGMVMGSVVAGRRRARREAEEYARQERIALQRERELVAQQAAHDLAMWRATDLGREWEQAVKRIPTAIESIDADDARVRELWAIDADTHGIFAPMEGELGRHLIAAEERHQRRTHRLGVLETVCVGAGVGAVVTLILAVVTGWGWMAAPSLLAVPILALAVVVVLTVWTIQDRVPRSLARLRRERDEVIRSRWSTVYGFDPDAAELADLALPWIGGSHTAKEIVDALNLICQTRYTDVTWELCQGTHALLDPPPAPAVPAQWPESVRCYLQQRLEDWDRRARR